MPIYLIHGIVFSPSGPREPRLRTRRDEPDAQHAHLSHPPPLPHSPFYHSTDLPRHPSDHPKERNQILEFFQARPCRESCRAEPTALPFCCSTEPPRYCPHSGSPQPLLSRSASGPSQERTSNGQARFLSDPS